MTDDCLLFLDIDGVLNAHERDPDAECHLIDRDKMIRLNHILRAGRAMVVLSSSWRHMIYRGEMDLIGMDWLLRTHGFMRGRLIGATRPVTRESLSFGDVAWGPELERGELIREWRSMNGHSGPYVVLDDGHLDRASGRWSDLGISGLHPAVFVDGRIGLTGRDADRAVEILLRREPAGGA